MAEPQAASARESVGHTLKALREAQNLTLADIAGRLHLDPRIIAAIEAGDHAALPAALYVRGYLRGYARILGANPEQIVEIFNDQSPSTPPEIIPEISRPRQSTSEDTSVRITTAAVAILLAALLAVWWESTYRTRPGPTAAAPAATPAPASMPELAAPAPAPMSQLGYSYSIVTHPDAPKFTGAGTAATPVAEQPPTATTAIGTDQILFRASTDSWLEVTDHTGDRIYMDFLRGGESLTLTGQAPFDVLIGYAPGVKVEFNGRGVDIMPDTRAGVARFSLGR